MTQKIDLTTTKKKVSQVPEPESSSAGPLLQTILEVNTSKEKR